MNNKATTSCSFLLNVDDQDVEWYGGLVKEYVVPVILIVLPRLRHCLGRTTSSSRLDRITV